MRGSATLERATQSLQRSQQVAHETEEVGEAIVDDLGVQREALERARSRLHDTDVELSRSRRVLKRMARGTIYNKVTETIVGCNQKLIPNPIISGGSDVHDHPPDLHHWCVGILQVVFKKQNSLLNIYLICLNLDHVTFKPDT